MIKFKANWFSLAIFWGLFSSSASAMECRDGVIEVGDSQVDRNIYVVDTNILISEPHLFALLADKHLVIPRTVIEELDRIKSKDDVRSVAARYISATIKRLIESSPSLKEIPLAGGGDVTFSEVSNFYKWPDGFNPDKPDHRIVGLARQLQDLNSDRKVVVYTRDNNVSILAKSVALSFQQLTFSVEPKAAKQIFEGPVVVKAKGAQIDKLKKLPDAKSISLQEAANYGLSTDVAFHQNQFVVFDSVENPYNAFKFNLDESLKMVWRYGESKSGEKYLKPVNRAEINNLVMKPNNIEQIMAFDLLLDRQIDLVSLTGKAGTGKTLLTLIGGLSQSPLLDPNSRFDRIILTRPNEVTGKEMGFLPGSLKEKMDPYLGPFEDNFEVIIEAMRKNAKVRLNPLSFPAGKNRNPSKRGHSVASLGKGLAIDDFLGPTSIKDMVSRIKDSDFFHIHAIPYSRGRSWRKTLLIIDEAQNLTPLELLTILTRASQGTKVVFLGDVFQIDSKGLNVLNNGLALVSTKFKGKYLAGHVNLVVGERSALATMASEILSH
ncbi:MAG: hypothetical protein JWQ35_2282 [Bacteriovoracaceae bacterium]|nr:hypothetical protein [Bacteriovoracaceae bacterium]